MRIAFALLLLAACGTKTGSGGGDDGGVANGGECDASHDCSDGKVCSITHDASGVGECLDATGDIDGDGLLNSQDYCNSGPGGQYDEDRDLIGDDCDKCPIAPPRSTPDPDNDDVESPCDPDPRTPGDKIVVFQGFRTGIPQAYKQTGVWTVNSGGDAVIVPEAGTTATLTTSLPLQSTNIAVFAGYRVNSVDANQGRNYVGIVAKDARPASSAHTSCGAQRSAGADSLAIENETTAASMNMTNAFDTASLYEVTLGVEGLNQYCVVIADSDQIATQATSTGEALTEAGLFAQGASVQFQYLLVVQRAAALD
ncbi:MAG TPA: hypothetical protein VGM90_00180 [Kofleriaceae bacterium]|jgi:hypothetical protein